MEFQSEDGLVTVLVENDELTWIGVSPSFRKLPEPVSVLVTVIEMVNEHAPRPDGDSGLKLHWGPGYDYDQMDRINRELDRLAGQLDGELEEFPSQKRTVTAVGRNGYLSTFLMTEEYFERVAAQQLSEAITEAVTAMLAAQTGKDDQ